MLPAYFIIPYIRPCPTEEVSELLREQPPEVFSSCSGVMRAQPWRPDVSTSVRPSVGLLKEGGRTKS